MPRGSSSLSKQYNQLKRETLRELRKIRRYLGRDRFIKSFAFRYAKELGIIVPKGVKVPSFKETPSVVMTGGVVKRKPIGRSRASNIKISEALQHRVRRHYFKKYDERLKKPSGFRLRHTRIPKITINEPRAEGLELRDDAWYKDKITRLKVYRNTEGTSLGEIKKIGDTIRMIGNDTERTFTDDEIDSRMNEFLDTYINVPGATIVLSDNLDSLQLQQLQQYSRAHGMTKEERDEIFYQLKHRLQDYLMSENEKAQEVFNEYYDHPIIDAEWSVKK